MPVSFALGEIATAARGHGPVVRPDVGRAELIGVN
jgi:hypothetical protein